MPHLLVVRRVAAALVLLAAASSYAQSTEYGVREDKARAGTMVRRFVVSGAPVPLDKRYADLTPDEKGILRQPYQSMAPGDEPPFPADGLGPIYEAVAKAQLVLLIHGQMNLLVDVGASGDAAQVGIVGGADADMAKAAAGVVMATKFKPAVCGGQPCKMQLLLHFDFPQRDEIRVH